VEGFVNILVTGAAGYVGSVVTPALMAASHRVRACDIVPPAVGEPLVGDVCDAALQRESVRDIDAVVHLAGIIRFGRLTSDDLRLMRAVNVDATRGLVAAAAAASVRRFLVASTCGVYGVCEEPADEDHAVAATSAYAETKLEAERIVLAARNGLAGTVLRLATVFGGSPHLSFEPLANALVREAVMTKRVVIYGASARRPFVHVRDVARAIVIVLARRPDEVAGQIFNVGSERLVRTKGEIAARLREIVPGLIVETKSETDARNYSVAFRKLARLGFEATAELEPGLREVADLAHEQVGR
jgi:nucleoside-diphosphate-sugar epimerase